MKIKNASYKDLNQILELAKEEPYFRVSNTDETCFWDKKALERMIDSPQESIFLVAKEDERIIGFTITQYWPAGAKATFENAFIIPEYRRTGLYKKLGLKMIGRLRNMGCEYICGFPEIDNPASYKSLEKNFGFDRGKKYYWMGKLM